MSAIFESIGNMTTLASTVETNKYRLARRSSVLARSSGYINICFKARHIITQAR